WRGPARLGGARARILARPRFGRIAPRARGAFGRLPLRRPGREPLARRCFAPLAEVRGRRGRAAAHGTRPGPALEGGRGGRRPRGRALRALGEGGPRRGSCQVGRGGSVGGRVRPARCAPRWARADGDAHAIHVVARRRTFLTL